MEIDVVTALRGWIISLLFTK